MSITGKRGVGIPLILLYDAEGSLVTIELKSGEVFRGFLRIVEDSMNVVLAEATRTSDTGKVTRVDSVFLRGAQIRFFVLPDMYKRAPMFKRIKLWRRYNGHPPPVVEARGRSLAIITKARERMDQDTRIRRPMTQGGFAQPTLPLQPKPPQPPEPRSSHAAFKSQQRFSTIQFFTKNLLMATLSAPIKFAQRKDSLYVTINIPDVVDHSINLTETRLEFSGTSNGKRYTNNLNFFKEVNTEGSVWKVLPRSIQMNIIKKDKRSVFWTRLNLDKNVEKQCVSVDWERYVDEDEERGDFDMSNLSGGMNFGGYDGQNFGDMDLGGDQGEGPDSDDDDVDGDESAIPDLAHVHGESCEHDQSHGHDHSHNHDHGHSHNHDH